MSSISNNFPLFTPTKTSSSPSFSTRQKDRREGRWCVTDAIFRLSVREINIDTVFLTRGFLAVCVGLWFHYPLLSHFFLKNQTITDVATEIETLILEGLSEQVRLPGGSAISPVCCGSVNPPRIPRAQWPFSFINLNSSLCCKLLYIEL